jgi:branched-chain amino acid transport system substrate-binding protein
MKRRAGWAPAVAALAVLVAPALAGCGSSSVPSSEAELAAGAPVKIGYLASLTGFCAGFSREYVAGAELAVRQIDAHGGVLGHRLELIVRDDWATPSVGIARARALVLGEHVKYLAGTCTSEVAKSIAELIANPSHVLYVVGASEASVFAGSPETYVFDTIPTATVEGRYAAAYVRAHPRWKRIAVIGEDYGYGYQVTGAFKRALAAGQPGSSGQRIVSVQYLPVGGSDYRPYVERVLAAHPDAIYSTAITEDAVTLVEQGLGLGLFRTPVLGVMDYATMADMHELPIGAEGYTVYPSASIYGTPLARDLESLGTGVANGGAAGEGFNQIEVITQGIEKADSTDPTKVRDALGGATVQTVQGAVKVNRCDHQLAMPIAMGSVAGPTAAQPFAHLEPLRLVDTGGYYEC